MFTLDKIQTQLYTGISCVAKVTVTVTAAIGFSSFKVIIRRYINEWTITFSLNEIPKRFGSTVAPNDSLEIIVKIIQVLHCKTRSRNKKLRSVWFHCVLLFFVMRQSLYIKLKNGSKSTENKNASYRVPTRPGKPGKMRVHLENLEISWNFEKFSKYHGKMTWNLENLVATKNSPLTPLKQYKIH